ncbi:MAG: hypothetical protein ACREB9_00260 [Thermoplasmata archaeon]
MRTKTVERAIECRLVESEPRVSVYLRYDGLAGLSTRPWLCDVLECLVQDGLIGKFLGLIRKKAGNVTIEFEDYASYGVGGGNATATFYFGSVMLLHVPAAGATPEHLWLQGHGHSERVQVADLEEAAPTP